MIKIFTLIRDNLGSAFNTAAFDAWMLEHPDAQVISTSNSDLAMTITVKYQPPAGQ